MPELPEVETIRRELAPLVLGQTLRSVRVQRPDIIGFPNPRAFAKRVQGRTVTGVLRRGKFLVLELSGNVELVIHLRLSGRLLVVPGPEHPRYERLRLGLSGGQALVFVEPRALGRAYAVLPEERPHALSGMYRLGLEPLDARFTAQHLWQRVRGRRAFIKNLLLDQEVAAGVGNIYSDEALFVARVHPLRRASRLRQHEVGRLARALRRVLEEGIAALGTTFSAYQRPDGQRGQYQEIARVYGREGEPCRRCGRAIVAVRIANRRTRFCPSCQPRRG